VQRSNLCKAAGRLTLGDRIEEGKERRGSEEASWCEDS